MEHTGLVFQNPAGQMLASTVEDEIVFGFENLGLTSAFLAAFRGQGDFGPLDTFLSYLSIGIGVDLAPLLPGSPENLIVAALAGTFGHMGRLLVKWLLGGLVGAPMGFVALGLARSLVVTWYLAPWVGYSAD